MEKEISYITTLFNENIKNCREAMIMGQEEMACYARGCAQGIASALYISKVIDQETFDIMIERIRRTITMEDE